jgi:hypothetical protein
MLLYLGHNLYKCSVVFSWNTGFYYVEGVFIIERFVILGFTILGSK